MKFLLLTLLLTVGTNSAYAITCNSEDSANKFDIEAHSFGKYTAKLYVRAISHVFAGTISKPDILTDEYSFYDQNGAYAKFTLKKKIHSSPSQHCRYRHGCGHSRVPSTISIAPSKFADIGKLEIEGQDSEYFNCF
jgi:hypothetical protein